jgi:hypothetical protein
MGHSRRGGSMSPPPKAAAGTREVGRLPDLRIRILHVPDCPLVSPLRADVESALASVGARAVIEEIEGSYPSPTLLIGGIDVTGRALGSDPACRLDVPARDQIVAAIRAPEPWTQRP